jgi:sugar phosphate isomerase/epimerase
MCNTRETLDFVKEINHNAIKLHLDMGTILVNNEDINILSEAKDYITHFHFSEPNLEVLIDRPEYKKAIHLLS